MRLIPALVLLAAISFPAIVSAQTVSIKGKVRADTGDPIPYAAITANNKGQLSQNFGYDGYDAGAPKWDNWEDAVADESTN